MAEAKVVLLNEHVARKLEVDNQQMDRITPRFCGRSDVPLLGVIIMLQINNLQISYLCTVTATPAETAMLVFQAFLTISRLYPCPSL